MKKWMIVAVGASCIVASHPAFAQNVRAVTCTGILIDVWLKPRAEWPLAVIYDATDHFTCTIDRQNHGHDMKPCAAGEKCRVVGMARVFGYEEQGFQTYSIQTITSLDSMPDEGGTFAPGVYSQLPKQ